MKALLGMWAAGVTLPWFYGCFVLWPPILFANRCSVSCEPAPSPLPPGAKLLIDFWKELSLITLYNLLPDHKHDEAVVLLVATDL